MAVLVNMLQELGVSRKILETVRVFLFRHRSGLHRIIWCFMSHDRNLVALVSPPILNLLQGKGECPLFQEPALARLDRYRRRSHVPQVLEDCPQDF